MSYQRSSKLHQNTRVEGGHLTPHTVRKYARDITARIGSPRTPREALSRLFLDHVAELGPLALELDPDTT